MNRKSNAWIYNMLIIIKLFWIRSQVLYIPTIKSIGLKKNCPHNSVPLCRLLERNWKLSSGPSRSWNPSCKPTNSSQRSPQEDPVLITITSSLKRRLSETRKCLAGSTRNGCLLSAISTEDWGRFSRLRKWWPTGKLRNSYFTKEILIIFHHIY